MYDAASDYKAKMREYVDAFKRGDDAECKILEAWFHQNYPLSTADWQKDRE